MRPLFVAAVIVVACGSGLATLLGEQAPASAPSGVTGTDAPPLLRVIPRPPVRERTEADGSAVTDGYAPIPEWAGQTRAPRATRTESVRVEEVASGIGNGFSFHFLPDGRIILSERPGRMRIVGRDGKLSDPIGGLPQLYASGPQGLFEVRPDRNFAANRVIYFGYTVLPPGPAPDPLPRLPGILMIARARLSADDTRLEDVKVLLNAEGINGRLIQARDGTLLVTSGIPAGVGIHSPDWPQPQQLDSLMGKVLRITTDGAIPPDNPFASRSGARPEIYAIGLRDDQGVAVHPDTGKLWTSENGPKGGDEINVIEPGRNYGFPAISYGREYSGKQINGDRAAASGMQQPVYFWTPSIAPSGMTFYTGRQLPAWRGNLFVAAMAGRHLVRLVLDGERVVGEERLLTGLNTRFRDVRDGPDGALYAMTDGPEGKILRLVPPK
jgi:glucose/arabinose dehydrogenase